MMNKSLFILFAVLLTTAVRAERCNDSIRTNMSDNQSVFIKIKIDISDYIDLNNHQLTPDSILSSTAGLAIYCNIDHLYQLPVTQENNAVRKNIVIPVKASVTNDVPWVIYLSKFDDDRFSSPVEGMALSIVTFDHAGKVIDSFPLSTFTRYDGFAEKSSAEIQDNILTICLQDIDYFSYDENGDRTDLLAEPIISTCKTEKYLVERGMFKLITSEELFQ